MFINLYRIIKTPFILCDRYLSKTIPQFILDYFYLSRGIDDIDGLYRKISYINKDIYIIKSNNVPKSYNLSFYDEQGTFCIVCVIQSNIDDISDDGYIHVFHNMCKFIVNNFKQNEINDEFNKICDYAIELFTALVLIDALEVNINIDHILSTINSNIDKENISFCIRDESIIKSLLDCGVILNYKEEE